MIIYMYIAPGWGQINPMVPIVLRLIDIRSYCPFDTRFSFKRYFNSFPINMHRRPMMTLP